MIYIKVLTIILVIVYAIYRAYLKSKYYKYRQAYFYEEKDLDNEAKQETKESHIIKEEGKSIDSKPNSYYMKISEEQKNTISEIEKMKHRYFIFVQISQLIIFVLAFINLFYADRSNVIFFASVILLIHIINIIFEVFHVNVFYFVSSKE